MTALKLTLIAGILVVGLAVGFGTAYKIYGTKPGKPETPAVEVRQKDGSLILERNPGDQKSNKPAQLVPKGAIVERIVQVTVQPKTIGSTAATSPNSPELPRSPQNRPGFNLTTLKIPSLGGLGSDSGGVCPPVRVDLSLIRLKDKSQRVLASSPDGEVVGGVDIPVEPVTLPRIQRWTAAGLRGYDTQHKRGVWGGELSYQRGPFVVTGGGVGTTIFVGAGVRF